jgi:ABC-type sugar transport system permease subunit
VHLLERKEFINNISLEKMHFFGLFPIIILQYTVQKKHKKQNYKYIFVKTEFLECRKLLCLWTCCLSPKDNFKGLFIAERFQWSRGLRRGSKVTRVLRLWVWIPSGSWISVSCKCCVLSDRGFCVGLITPPEESYRVWCVWVWSWNLDNEDALAQYGLLRKGKKQC